MTAATTPAPLAIKPGHTAHRVLLALRPGAETDQATIADRIGGGAHPVLTELQRAGYVERIGGGIHNNNGATWRITHAGREACPPRRGAFTDYHDFSTQTMGDL